jgi:hypothetical protein
MRAILTPDDLKKGELIDPGWHPAEIVDYTEDEAGEEAKNPGSTNCIFHFKIIDGPMKGMQCKRLFNETALGFGKALWLILYGPPDPQRGYADGQLSTEQFKQQIGKKLKIYVERGKSNRGNYFNDVKDFLPLTPAA